jgi:hypothetical protein
VKIRLPLLCFALAASPLTLALGVDFVVVNTNPSGPGSLAQAITDANNLPGPDRVVFNIPGAGVRTIDVSYNYLPKITDPLTIDGYTQPGSAPNTLARGSNAVILIRIDGAYANTIYYQQPPPVGLWIEAPDCTVRGLMITRFSPFTSGLHCCAYPHGFGIIATTRSVIEGNFIGTDGTASTNLGNKGAGIVVAGSDYRIGGTTPAARNMIGGNSYGNIRAEGIVVGSSTRGSIIGNHIGRYTPVTGSSGAETEGAPNDIGIALYGTFTDTVIGGTAPGSGNVISGNGIGISTGYEQNGPGFIPTVATGVIIQGNLIGAEPGAATIAANDIGIELHGSNHVIGGTAPGASNLIGSNRVGISFSQQAGPPTENRIFGNDIVANVERGISVVGHDNHIGSLAAGTGNHIHLNGVGIVVLGTPAQQNRILSNIIEDNTAPAQIDLSANGPTSNDFGDGDNGPNRFQNFPTVALSYDSVGNTIITGELNSTPSSSFTVQLFGTLQGEQNQRLLNTQTVVTDANGIASFQATYPGGIEASSLTATATDSLGSTSELMPHNGPVQLANISTRAVVGTGHRIMIGGFIIRSASLKKVAVRALGPSLPFPNRLADPYLEIRDQNGALAAKNDDWGAGGQQQELMDNGLAPSSGLESAIVISLPEGNYTAQVSGAGGQTGTAIVELYDLGAWPADSGRLLNLSTRGQVGLNDEALIGGFIVRGDAQGRVIIRAIGPDLTALGVPDALTDPTLELRNQNGALLASNDDWANGSQEEEIEQTQLAPNDPRDSAIVAALFPGTFTAIVKGKNGETGLALVEFYDLKQ